MLYAFTGTAAIRGLIDAPYVRAPSFRRSHLYVRTVKGVFFVYFRSLAELLEHLGAMHFLLLHYGLCVNPHLEMELDLSSKRKRIGIAVNEKETEWLIVSRRHVVSVRELFGLRPQRRKLKQKHESKQDHKITGEEFGRTEFCEKS